MPRLLKAASVFFAAFAVVFGCGLSIRISPSPELNGQVLYFDVGETKVLSDGEDYITLTYNGEGESPWTCQDNFGGELCLYFADRGGAQDPDNPGALLLMEDWREVDEPLEPHQDA